MSTSVRTLAVAAGCALALAACSGPRRGIEGDAPKALGQAASERLESASGAAHAASESIESTWGAAVSSVRLSAGGYMIDFRYKVLDPEKAAPLAGRETRAYLIDEKTGGKFLVPATPKVGAMRQTPRQLAAGKIYFVFFANPGKSIKAGDRVTVVIGEYRAENLLVEA
ncbi:MAG TPA: hypothetical protein DCM87_10575 [Planctomycetes bacterium]|nr:hypothetical protein [Planctomycetota bacterium]